MAASDTDDAVLHAAGAIATADRRADVVAYLADNGSATIREMADHFGVVRYTIWSVIDDLRVYGIVETDSGGGSIPDEHSLSTIGESVHDLAVEWGRFDA